VRAVVDWDDLPVLARAVFAQVDVIITGDNDLLAFPAQPRGPVSALNSCGSEAARRRQIPSIHQSR
jgi:hypothetical protein